MTPEVLGSHPIAALKAAPKSLAILLRHTRMPIGLVAVHIRLFAIFVVGSRRLDAVVEAVPSHLVELRRRNVPAVLHIARRNRGPVRPWRGHHCGRHQKSRQRACHANSHKLRHRSSYSWSRICCRLPSGLKFPPPGEFSKTASLHSPALRPLLEMKKAAWGMATGCKRVMASSS